MRREPTLKCAKHTKVRAPHCPICLQAENDRIQRELRKKLRRAREALRWVRRDCEICDWHCHVCGADQGAKEFDLYGEVVRALKETK